MASEKQLSITAEERLTLLRKVAEKLKAAEKPPHPDQRYLVIAHNHNQFRIWARQYGLGIANLIVVDDPKRAAGIHDYWLIAMTRAPSLPADFVARLYEEAAMIIDTRYMYPVADVGRIIGWREFKHDTRAK